MSTPSGEGNQLVSQQTLYGFLNEGDVRQELARRSAERDALIDKILSLKNELQDVNELNKALAEQINSIHGGQAPSSNKAAQGHNDIRPEGLEIDTSFEAKGRSRKSTNDDYGHLVKKYHRLMEERDHYRDAYDQVRSKLKYTKDGWRAWVQHIGKSLPEPSDEEDRIDLLGPALHSIIVQLRTLTQKYTRNSSPLIGIPTPQLASPHPDQHPVASEQIQARPSPEEVPTVAPVESVGPDPEMLRPADTSSTATIDHPITEQVEAQRAVLSNSIEARDIPSSQVTEGDSLPDHDRKRAKIQTQPESSPEIIFARPVKRKRVKDTNPAPAAIQIKREPLSQEDNLAQFSVLTRNETLDLDEMGEKMFTPRKRQRFHESLKASRLSEQSHDRGQSAAVKNEPSPTLETPSIIRKGPKPLRTLSTNVQRTPRTTAANTPRSKNPKKVAHGINMLAEDSEHMSRRSKGRVRREDIVESDLRLQTLLDSPHLHTPSPVGFQTDRVKSASRNPSISRDDDQQVAVGANDKLPAESRNQRPSHIPQTKSLKKSTPERPRASLRLLTPSKLSLDDFRVNPEFNQGVDYAFTEVVRGRNARRCLPGCTKPECCGTAFRDFAQVGGLQSYRRLWDSSQDDQRPKSTGNISSAAEDRTLREHLGLGPHEPLPSLGRERRAELLELARVQAMADQYGKHRHAFERRTTPPGFWRTEMPSTQELEEDRAEAARREKEEVTARYYEALKKRGRYKFRDEV